jgi:hypothetical protein
MIFIGVMIIALAAVFGLQGGAFAQDYEFKVHNTTKNTIKKLLVSEDNKEWGHFDIGKGIAPGATETIVWDNSTNNEECKQYIKAVYDDGSESEPTIFDFCEKKLELEF